MNKANLLLLCGCVISVGCTIYCALKLKRYEHKLKMLERCDELLAESIDKNRENIQTLAKRDDEILGYLNQVSDVTKNGLTMLANTIDQHGHALCDTSVILAQKTLNNDIRIEALERNK